VGIMAVNPIDKAIKIMEKDLEDSLNEKGRYKPWKAKDGTPQSFQFLNKEIFTKDWQVEISFSGGFDEQHFNVSAYSPKLDNGTDFDTWVKLGDPDEEDEEKYDYEQEVADLMELSLDDVGTELIDKLNEELT
jgi:hypothetical protein